MELYSFPAQNPHYIKKNCDSKSLVVDQVSRKIYSPNPPNQNFIFCFGFLGMLKNPYNFFDFIHHQNIPTIQENTLPQVKLERNTWAREIAWR